MWVVALQNLLCRLGLAHVEAHLTMDRNTWRGARVITFAMVHTRYRILGTHLPKPKHVARSLAVVMTAVSAIIGKHRAWLCDLILCLPVPIAV
jgi:hypothetical protein